MDQYNTLARSGSSELRVKASRFFGFAQPVSDVVETESLRGELRKRYHDAQHQPFAYRLTDDGERTSDDGEPHGSAGIPILTEIRALNLFDVQVVVVRYFGGTKLGKGGLARAFAEAARLALTEGAVQMVQNLRSLTVHLQPEAAAIVRVMIAKLNGQVAEISYDREVHLRLAVPASQFDVCRETLSQRFGNGIFR